MSLALKIEASSDDEAFLADAPPLVSSIHRYWMKQRGERAMPRRADIDPADFPYHLPDIVLVDVLGSNDKGLGVFRYRVVGTSECLIRGWDPTGCLVGEGFFGLNADYILSLYEQIRQTGQPLWAPSEFKGPDGRTHKRYSIFLPLSEDGEIVSQVLVYCAKNPALRKMNF